MAKAKEEKDEGAVGTFPKMASTAVIKNCNMKPEGADIKFDNLKFSSDQYAQMSGLIEEKEEVLVTIQATQGKLPGC